MASLSDQVKRLPPLLERIKPQEWVTKGGSPTWIKQHESARNSVANLVAATDRLSKDPERLTAAIDTLLRFDTIGVVLTSLRDGTRKYQGDAMANELSTAITDTFSMRETLKQHVTDLAALREQEMRLMDQEAQRCRGDLTRATPPSPGARPLTRSRNRSAEKN